MKNQFLCAAFLLTTAIPLSAAIAQSALPAIFRASSSVIATLKGSTIPVLLPKRLGSATQADPLYIQILSLTDNGYSLVLAADEQPCGGQHVCSAGSLSAGTSPFVHGELLPSAVRLTRGITGHYFPTDCGAYCSEAYMDWKQDKYFYSIGIKAGSKRQLTEAANSAIKKLPPVKRTVKVRDTQ